MNKTSANFEASITYSFYCSHPSPPKASQVANPREGMTQQLFHSSSYCSGFSSPVLKCKHIWFTHLGVAVVFSIPVALAKTDTIDVLCVASIQMLDLHLHPLCTLHVTVLMH